MNFIIHILNYKTTNSVKQFIIYVLKVTRKINNWNVIVKNVMYGTMKYDNLVFIMNYHDFKILSRMYS